jgi:hypothetical protein
MNKLHLLAGDARCGEGRPAAGLPLADKPLIHSLAQM